MKKIQFISYWSCNWKYRTLECKMFFESILTLQLLMQILKLDLNIMLINLSFSTLNSKKSVFPEECTSFHVKHTLIWLTKLSPLLHHLYRILKSKVHNTFNSLLQSCVNLTRINFSPSLLIFFIEKSAVVKQRKLSLPPPLLNHMAVNWS